MNIIEIENILGQIALDLSMVDVESRDEHVDLVKQLEALQLLLSAKEFDYFSKVLSYGLTLLKSSLSDTKVDLLKILNYFISFLQDIINKYKTEENLGDDISLFENELRSLIGDKQSLHPSVILSSLTEEQLRNISEFASNTSSLVEEIENDILFLEQDISDSERINNVFRAFHTIKGEANLLGLLNLGLFAHKTEDILDKIRSSELSLTSNVIEVLLFVSDKLKNYLLILDKSIDEALNIDFENDIDNLNILIKEDSKKDTKSYRNQEMPRIINQDKEMLDEKKEEMILKEIKPKHESEIPDVNSLEDLGIVGEFISESKDHLTASEDSILDLEKNPSDKDAINNVFRAFHTIKGLSSFLNLKDIRVLAHTTETMLDLVRKDQLEFNDNIADATLKSIDSMRTLFSLLSSQIANQGNLTEPYFDVGEHIDYLGKIIENEPSKLKCDNRKPIGEILLNDGIVTPIELEEALDFQEKNSSGSKIGEILQNMNAVSKKDVDRALSIQAGAAQNSIKINIDKLDLLVDLVGELVISETQVVQNKNILELDDRRLLKDVAQLDRITRSLQEVSMAMRLVPIKSTFQKMMRIVRDLSKKSKKDIDVKLTGEETEIDKNMVELISDPLIHMVRNSADHGIESKEIRLKKGKCPIGLIELAAYHRGGNVLIEISDDGAGLNKEKILRKGIERGLIKVNEQLEDKQIYSLIFEPGFSTAEKVTDVSGRGVGMDVVRTNIEDLRGKIEISSEKDKGTKFSIFLPITLAIIEGIVIRVANERYIIPINSIIEFAEPKKEYLIDMANKGQAYKFHENIFPIVFLEEYFKINAEATDFESKTICAVDSDYGKACFVVDELYGQQQVVIKSLGDKLKRVNGISGGAILGDGRIGLILDVNDILYSLRNIAVEI